MKNKQRALITSINNLNKSFEVKMIEFQLDFTLTLNSENDADVLSIPKGKLRDYIEVGDLIEFKISGQNDCKMFNLSSEFLRLSKFKRDLTSILRRLDNDNHPQKRCVLLNEPSFVLLSVKKNPEKINSINEATQKVEEQHEKF